MTQDAIFAPSGPTDVIFMDKLPGVPSLFAKLICLSMVRPTTLVPGTTLENKCVVYPGVTIDSDKLETFKQVCGYKTGEQTVPAPFIQILFIGVVSKFIGSSFFPISPMGLIQVGQSYELKQPLSPDQPLDLFCRLLDMTQTEKGIHTRVLMEAVPAGSRGSGSDIKSDPDETDLIWQGIATYFTRSKTKQKKEKKQREPDTPLPIMETIQVPENTGRKYAAVSRDYNPHHLYGWTAKFIGFKQAIAHGMWSLARAGASLEKAAGFPELSGMEGALKLPIFMPATITLGYEFTGTEAAFELRDKDTGVPHLKGTYRYLKTPA